MTATTTSRPEKGVVAFRLAAQANQSPGSPRRPPARPPDERLLIRPVGPSAGLPDSGH